MLDKFKDTESVRNLCNILYKRICYVIGLNELESVVGTLSSIDALSEIPDWSIDECNLRGKKILNEDFFRR